MINLDLNVYNNLEWNSIYPELVSKTSPPLKIRNEIFQDVYGILIDNNIRAWITGGTLLGAVRDGSFIDWDDDIDMDMLEEDFIKVMFFLKNILMSKGYFVRLNDDKHPKMSFFKKGLKISLGGLKSQGKWLTRPIQKYPKNLFINDHYINFCSVRCRIPYPPEKYLEHVYGKTWRIPIRGDGYSFHSIKFLNYRAPASYFIAVKIILMRIYKNL